MRLRRRRVEGDDVARSDCRSLAAIISAPRVLVAALVVATAALGTPSGAHGARGHAAIVGGESAPTGSFPSVVWIGDRDGRWVEQCTGTVVAPFLVLTAGHCLISERTGAEHPAAGFRVGYGSPNFESRDLRVTRVSEVIANPDYNSFSGAGDAGLLVLSEPIAAPAVGLPESAPPEEGRVFTAGWGLVSPEENETPMNLQWGQTNILGVEECERVDRLFDPEQELCVSDLANEASVICSGDSGGPLITSQGADGIEIGVADIGTTGCRPDYPAIYARTDVLLPWISEARQALAPIEHQALTTTTTAQPGVYRTVRGRTHSVTLRVTSDAAHLVHFTARLWLPCEHGYYYRDVVPLYFGESAAIEEGVVRSNLTWAATKWSGRETDGLFLRFTDAGLVEGRITARVRLRGRAGLCAVRSESFWAYRSGG